jgi:hypothetical protein
VTLLFFSVFFSQFFVTTLYLQDVLGFSALRTGLGFLPFGVAVGAALGLATNIIPRFGYRPVLVTGLLLSLVGALLFTRITADGSYLTQVLPRRWSSRSARGCACPCSATPPSTA